jgi:TolB protein
MSSRTGERPNLWLMDVEGDNPMQLTSDNTFESQPEWSSDGRRITYLAKGVPHERLLSIDVTTRRTDALIDLGALRPASESPTRAPLAEVRLSRSTKHIVFSLREPPGGHRVLYVTEMTPLAPRRLTDASLSVGYPSWSPDERRVAVEIKDGSSTQAGVIDLETGLLRPLTSERGQTWIRSWSPNGRSVAAAALREGQWSVRAFDVDGGRERVITPPAPPRIFVRYPDWSARGDRIVYERSEMTGNIWLLPLRAAPGVTARR